MEQKTVNLFEGYQKRAGWKTAPLHNCKRRSIMGPPPGDRLSADIVEALN